MDPETTVEMIVDVCVLVPTTDGELLALDPEFEDAVSAYREDLATLSDPALNECIEKLTVDLADVVALEAICKENLDLLAALEILAETTDISPALRLDVLPAIDQFLRGPPCDDGTPDGFLPVHANLLSIYMAQADRSIVFIWREHCSSCRVMCEELEATFEAPPDDITLLSVYGPNTAVFLLEQYDVQSGPTTLFTVNGDIDARLLGPQHREVIEQEIEYPRDG